MGTAAPVAMSSSTGWLAVGAVGVTAVATAVSGNAEPSTSTAVWWLVYAAYALAFWLSDPRPGVWARVTPATSLAALLVTGVALVLLDPAMGWTSILLVSTAVVAAFGFDQAVVAAVIVVQTLAVALSAATSGAPSLEVAVATLAYGVLQAFAAAMVVIARRETEARTALAFAHAELRAATRLLELSTRNEERLRISRDLHDALGHKLTALALALEVAQHHHANGPAQDQIRHAREIAKDLLTDVRTTVSTLRGTTTSLEPALRDLVAGIPHLDVQLTVEESVPLTAERSLAVVRCIQEVATNALRHGDARRLEIAVTSDRDGLRVIAQDDGRGTPDLRPGNGLTGMRERFDDLGGRVEFTSSPGAGFRLSATVPA